MCRECAAAIHGTATDVQSWRVGRALLFITLAAAVVLAAVFGRE